MSESDYKRKRLRDKVKAVANDVVAPVAGYDLKQPALFDFYEGEIENLNFDYLEALNPLRSVWQVTFGPRGRHWNGKIDYGVTEFVRQMNDRGMKYGLYHLMIPGRAAEQAEFYIKAVNLLGGLGHMMPILDVERTDVNGRQWAADVKTWLDIVRGTFGQPPLIYTNKYYWSFLNYRQDTPQGAHPTTKPKQIIAPPPWTKDYPGWFAGYPWIPYLDGNVTMPKTYQANGFKDWAIWQYCDQGRSAPPRGFPKYPVFPANDLNVISPWFQAYLDSYFG